MEKSPIARLDHFVTIIYNPPKNNCVRIDFSPGLVDLRAYPQLAGHIDRSECTEKCGAGQP